MTTVQAAMVVVDSFGCREAWLRGAMGIRVEDGYTTRVRMLANGAV